MAARKKPKKTPKGMKRTLSDRYPLVAQAVDLLKAVGFAEFFETLTVNRRERIALCLLAAAKLRPRDPLAHAAIGVVGSKWKPRTREFIAFWNKHYGMDLSSGSYDDVLRRGLVYLLMAGIVVSSHESNNIHDGTRGYVIPPDAADLIQKFGTDEWPEVLSTFVARNGTLSEKLAKKKGLRKTISVQTGDFDPRYSDGVHGELMRAVIEEFLPLHVRDYTILFFEDNLYKYMPAEALAEHNLQDIADRQAPDIIAIDKKRRLLFVFECVNTANPISASRHYELSNMTEGCVDKLRRVFVTVFKDRKALKAFITDICWETEVWLQSEPEHVIHFDGESEITSYDKPGS